MHAIIPLKSFDLAKGRLAPRFDPRSRSAIAQATAARVHTACVEAGFEVTVVAGDDVVAAWAAERGARTLPDPDRGLDDACAAGVAARSGPWVVVHGDLPLLDPAAMQRVRAALAVGRRVIAPSRDGGTNLLGADHAIPFSYGPGSFHRHLARIGPGAFVLVGAATAIEVDTPEDVTAAARLPGGAWLASFLS